MIQTNNFGIRQRVVIILLGASFIFILASSLVQRFTNPDLVIHNFPAQERALEEVNENMGGIGRLMQIVANNPQDRNAILKLVESLMAIGQWESAENFAQKALTLEGSNASDQRALYLLALVHHNKGEHEQAAELLEKTLAKGENPSARYSLGILYIHYLNKPEQGIDELRKGIAYPAVTPNLKAVMEDELNKVLSSMNKKTPQASAPDAE